MENFHLLWMDEPIGRAVGNALEIRESVAVLEGKGPDDVVELVEALGGAMLEIAGIERTSDAARARIRRAIDGGEARERFFAWVAAQGGDVKSLERDGAGLPRAPIVREAPAKRAGRVASIDARAIGYAANGLGAGRSKVGDRVDPRVGFEMCVRCGDEVREGQALAMVHAADERTAGEGAERIAAAIRIDEAAEPAKNARTRIVDRITV